MPENLIYMLLYGPRGPETRRVGDYRFGKTLEDAVAGNDDEDIVEKTGIIAKHTFFAATLFCSADIMFFHSKGGLPGAIKRMKYHYVPWLGATLAYTMAVSTTCSLRGGKTDQWNHVSGAFAAGAVVGRCVKSIPTGFFTGLALAVYSTWYKHAAMNDYKLFPDVTPRHGNPFSHQLDFTINKWWAGEKKGYWARTSEEAEKVYLQGQLGDENFKTTKLW